MSKVSFRARQIDFNKPLPILRNAVDLLSEFNENALVIRGVPQIPSGMEKEEENEHHFVEVINALQSGSDAAVKIPVPDIIDRTESYKQHYPEDFLLTKQLVHIRTILLSENEVTEYDMDSEDEEWLRKSELGISPDKFESMIDRLERGCGQKVMNLEEARYLLQDDPHLVIAVYDYWLNKRVQSQQPLLYAVRQEKRDGGSNSDPYVAFRRRSEKMQTRKNRKNDEQSYEKMLILRHYMSKLGDILSRLVDRETVKEAIVHNDYRLFQSQFCLKDWDGTHLAESESMLNKVYRTSESSFEVSPKVAARKRTCHKRKVCKRGGTPTPSSTSLKELSEEKHPENPFDFVRVPGCQYLKPRGLLAYEKQSYETSLHHPFRYSFTTVPSVCHSRHRTHCGYVRRRLGRGGRIVYDRLLPQNGNLDTAMDYCQRTSISNELDSNSTMHPWATDDALLRRLSTVILSNHRGRPGFKWPLCPKRRSHPSFTPLQPQPLPFSGESLIDKQEILVTKSEILSAQSKTIPSQSDLDPVEPQERLQCYDSQAYETLLTSDKKTIPPSAVQSLGCIGSPGYQQPVLSITDLKLAAPPFQIWRRIPRPYQPEFTISHGSDVQLPAANGVGSRLFKSPDGSLLRKEPPLLNPPKMRCLPRDCVKRDVNVPVRPITTANGVGKSPAFELPT